MTKYVFFFILLSVFCLIFFSCSDMIELLRGPAGIYFYSWVKTFGGISNQTIRGVACDRFNNVYVLGYFSGTTDFDPGLGTVYVTSAGSTDAFLVKINADGGFGGVLTFGGPATAYIQSQGLAIDQAGNVYIAGCFIGTLDFDPTGGDASRSSVGGSDAFVVKITAAGGFGWVMTFGGGSDDLGLGVACDADGNVYLAGAFQGSFDFNPGAGTDTKTSAGGYDAFLTRITSDGGYVSTIRYGSTGDDRGSDAACDAGGNLAFCGHFTGTVDFDPGAGTDPVTSEAQGDVFLSRFQSDGTYLWTRALGGDSGVVEYHTVTDRQGNILLAGSFQNTADFDPGPGVNNITSLGQTDVFAVKFTPDGDVVWTDICSGPDFIVAYGVAVDAAGNVFVGGDYRNTVDFNPGPGTDWHDCTGGIINSFCVRLNADGTYAWTDTFGEAIVTRGYPAVDQAGNLYVGGDFEGAPDFNPGPGTDSRTTLGARDAFLVRMGYR